jgi:TatD DNase family protein
LPRIAQVLAQLRGVSLADLAAATSSNACRVLPQLAALYHHAP